MGSLSVEVLRNEIAGGGICTRDLQVMSLARWLLLYPGAMENKGVPALGAWWFIDSATRFAKLGAGAPKGSALPPKRRSCAVGRAGQKPC